MFVSPPAPPGHRHGCPAAAPLVLANSPWQDAYGELGATRVGPASLHLDLPLGQWAADGLLAVFFFVAGLELKRELSPVTCAARARQCCRSPPRWAG